MKKRLSHLDDHGKARMVDIGGKKTTSRYARAEAIVKISKELYSRLRENLLEKGDALAIAKIAGISAAKKTAELIPLCHPIPLTDIKIDLRLTARPPSVKIISEVKTEYKTGVEMEALTAAAVAALTIYDMGKSIDKGITIESIRLLEKTGGKSGNWSAENSV